MDAQIASSKTSKLKCLASEVFIFEILIGFGKFVFTLWGLTKKTDTGIQKSNLGPSEIEAPGKKEDF